MSTLGYKHTAATKAKISAALTGEKNPNWGRKASAETRAKLSAAHSGRIVSAETRAKMAAALKGRALSAERRARMAVTSWRGDDIGYDAAHDRARKVLPKVCAHADETCKGPLECAFRHDTPPEFVKIDPRTSFCYSPRPKDYQRLCTSHHLRYDNAGRAS